MPWLSAARQSAMGKEVQKLNEIRLVVRNHRVINVNQSFVLTHLIKFVFEKGRKKGGKEEENIRYLLFPAASSGICVLGCHVPLHSWAPLSP